MKLYKELEAKRYEWDDVQGYYYNIVTHKNVIVLTLEELREVFDAGSNYVYLDVPHNQNFEQFLKSKGIQL